jgi:hypothetical protein
MVLTLILSIGLNAELLSTRNFVLQSAGYFVVPAYSLKEAADHFAGGDFDLVLVCQSIPTKDKDRLTSWIRASGSRIPVVSISGILSPGAAIADTTVESNPDEVLVGIRELLLKTASPVRSTPVSCRKNEASVAPQNEAPAQGKKPPQVATGHERQARARDEQCVPLAHAS